MGFKDCGHHKDKKKELWKKISLAILIVIYCLGFAIVILYLVLRPTNPEFVIQDATVYSLGLTGTTQMTSIIQVTVKAQNTNSRDGIYYDELLIYATYDDQRVTLPTMIPPTFQDTQESNVWSPFLRGESIPLSPYICAKINQDRSIGGIRLVIKLDGQIRLRVGSIITSRYHFHVSCPAIIPFGSNASSQGVLVANNAVKYQLVQSCSVS